MHSLLVNSFDAFDADDENRIDVGRKFIKYATSRPYTKHEVRFANKMLAKMHFYQHHFE